MKRLFLIVSFTIIAIMMVGCSTNEGQIKSVIRKYEKAQNSIGEEQRIEKSKPFLDDSVFKAMSQAHAIDMGIGSEIVKSVYGNFDFYGVYDNVEWSIGIGEIEVNNDIAQAEVLTSYKTGKVEEKNKKYVNALINMKPAIGTITLQKVSGKWVIVDIENEDDELSCKKCNTKSFVVLGLTHGFLTK